MNAIAVDETPWSHDRSATAGCQENEGRLGLWSMPKECPMCGEFMRLVTRETVSRVPGTSQEVKTPVREWVCPECDYFEEDEGGTIS
jgi:hypothetical protein